MGSKGSTSTASSSTTTRPDDQAYNLYSQLLQRAQGVASTPYQPFTGELVAPVNTQQNTGIAGINSYANYAAPYLQSALGIAQNAAQPITQQQIQQYMSPYIQNVVDATQNQFNSQNQQQQQQLTSNAIAQGALGGNRTGVAAANLAQAQQTAQAPVIAGLMNQGYTTGLNTALTEQQLGMSGAANLGSLGIGAQNAGLTGANAQIGAGTLQQQTQQAQDQANYSQFMNAQAFPYQQAQWLASLGTGVGSQMGGASTGNTTQTTPGPSGFSQILGGATGITGLLGQTGAFGSSGWLPGLFAMSDERAKENIQEVGRLHDGQRIYKFNYKGDPKTQIGLIAQEVEQHHPEAVREHNGLKMVDYDAATQGAEGVAGRADGGAADMGMSGTPWSGAQGFIPTANITHGGGAPRAQAPTIQLPSQQPQKSLQDQLKGISGLTDSIVQGMRGRANGVAGAPLDLSPPGGIPLDDTAPIGMGGIGHAATGGGIMGYAYGGAPTADDSYVPVDYTPSPDMSPDVRDITPPEPPASGIAPDMQRYARVIRNMESSNNYDSIGPATRNGDRAYGAYQVMGQNIPVWTKEVLGQPMTPEEFLKNPQAQDAVFNAKFGNYAQKYGPEGASKAWFAGEGGMNNPSARDALGTTTGEYARRFANGLDGQDGTPSPAQGARPTGAGSTSGAPASGVDWGANSKLWPALTAAGFAMMSSRSPFPGVAIGEGGLAGMQQYAADRSAGMQQSRLDMEAKRLDQQLAQKERELAIREAPYNGKMTTADKIRMSIENSKLEEMRRQHDLSVRTPVKIGMTKQGFDVYAMPRANKDGTVDYYPINPETGQMSPTPMGSGLSTPQNVPGPQSGGAPQLQQAQFNPDQSQGIIQRNQQALKTGIDYSEGAPLVEKGMEVPPPTEIGGRSAQAVATDAEYYLETGKLPPIRGTRGPVAVAQNAYRTAVQNYGNALAASRGLTPEKISDMWRTAPGMLRFVMGADGRATVSLGTAVRHLDTVAEYAKAWAAHDTQTINRLGAMISREFGSNAATNLEAVGKIVGPEIVKAIGVAGAGTEGERSAVEQQFSAAASPAQIQGAILATQKLLGGQLEGKRRQAAAAGVSEARFKDLIGDRPYEILSSLEKGSRAAHETPGAPANPAVSAQIPPPDQREAGKVYVTPKGPFKWTGKGWTTP